jgi:ABC-type cobalt transport system substrate-binding protein
LHTFAASKFFSSPKINIMNTKVLLAALAGAVVSFLTGWVIWGMTLKGFFEANTTDAGKAVMRGDDSMVMWAIFVGCLAWSLLMALVFSRWAGITTFRSGAIGGAWIGFLMALGADMFAYASMDAWTLTAGLIDAILNAAQGAIVGGVIGWALGYGNRA